MPAPNFRRACPLPTDADDLGSTATSSSRPLPGSLMPPAFALALLASLSPSLDDYAFRR